MAKGHNVAPSLAQQIRALAPYGQQRTMLPPLNPYPSLLFSTERSFFTDISFFTECSCSFFRAGNDGIIDGKNALPVASVFF
jgi:hypothetical protein